LLAMIAVAGMLLAAHGLTAGSAGLGAASAGLSRPSPKPAASGHPGGRRAPSSTPSGAPSPTPAPKVKLGPPLSQTQYAPYAYQVYPGALSPSARQAMAGFSIGVKVVEGTLRVTIRTPGSGQPPVNQTYPGAARVYFIEANLGDDSGGGEYNFGDDGVIATNAQGRIVG
jgi:hypothetical protein